MKLEENTKKNIIICGLIILALIVGFICGVIVFALVAGEGCTILEENQNMSLSKPLVTATHTPPATVPPTKVVRTTTKTQVIKTTVAPTKSPSGYPTITLSDSPVTTSYFCDGDTCGTLNIQLTCNPRTLFKRVAIIKIKDSKNTTERSDAVAAMGKNFADILPDGSVIPVKLNPGRYTLVLLDEKNIQVPETGGISSVKTVSVTTGKTAKAVFKEEC